MRKNNVIVNQVGLINSSREYGRYDNYYLSNFYENSNFNYKNDNYLSNVCYMNSSIQCLFHLNDFVHFILNSPGKPLVNSTRNLLINMINSKQEKYKNNLSVEEIKMEMGRIDDRYNHNRQEDANEFISNFLDALREETSVKYNKNGTNSFKGDLENEAYKKFEKKFYERRGDSSLLDLFYGNYITEKFCKKCRKKISVQFSAFNMIELPIYELAQENKYSSLNIKQILDSYFAESKIYESFCDKCYGDIYCKTSIYKLPENLIIFFGRTANDQYISNNIDYSQTLDLDDYLYDQNNTNKNNYKLSGIIHYISFGKKFGHYTASCQCNDGWYHFDDAMVTKGQNHSNEIILFYENRI